MKNKIIHISSVSELHRHYKLDRPKHPLVSVIELTKIDKELLKTGMRFQMDLYIISCKRFHGKLIYGRSHYDFDEGSLLFTSPGQVIGSETEAEMEQGWALFFHPDLLYNTPLGREIKRFSFFLYDLNEALHVSSEEDIVLQESINKIAREYGQNIDKHSQGLIVNNISLLLGYCDRFYDRQFFTRTKPSSDLVQRFERILIEYFNGTSLIDDGIPDVGYFSSRLNISAKYLSDLLIKFTGKSTQEHIHLHLIERAKSLLWSTEKTISEIAFSLGFEHPSHFTKIFKSKTGQTPKDYRTLN